jgi:hypothetical protein
LAASRLNRGPSRNSPLRGSSRSSTCRQTSTFGIAWATTFRLRPSGYQLAGLTRRSCRNGPHAIMPSVSILTDSKSPIV